MSKAEDLAHTRSKTGAAELPFTALTETHGDKDSPVCYNCARKLKDQEETQMPKGKNHVLQTICLKLRKKVN